MKNELLYFYVTDIENSVNSNLYENTISEFAYHIVDISLLGNQRPENIKCKICKNKNDFDEFGILNIQYFYSLREIHLNGFVEDKHCTDIFQKLYKQCVKHNKTWKIVSFSIIDNSMVI